MHIVFSESWNYFFITLVAFLTDFFRALILQKCIGSMYLLPATPPTVLGQSFSNFTGAFRMFWSYAYGFFRILKLFFSSPEQRSRRAIVLPPASALALALALESASTNVKVLVNVFKTSLFPNLITDLIHLWYDDTYWSKILCSTIPTTLGHVKVKVTDLEF